MRMPQVIIMVHTIKNAYTLNGIYGPEAFQSNNTLPSE